MASRNPLKSKEPNVATNTACRPSKLPHIIKDLYKSSDTLRRLRAPLPPRRPSTHNHSPAQPRTSRWDTSKSAIINTKARPMKKTTPRKPTNLPLAITLDELEGRPLTSHQPLGHAIQRTAELPMKMLSTALSQPLLPSSPPQHYPTPPPPRPTSQPTNFGGSLSYEELFASPIHAREMPTRSPQTPYRCNFFELHDNGFGAPRLDLLELQSQQRSHPAKDRALPPVYNLTDDCLIEIFQWCASSTTLCRLSAVCKHWRNVAVLPYVWRTIYYTWDGFVQQQQEPFLRRDHWKLGQTKRRKRNDRLPSDSLSPLEHVRTINISDLGRQPSLLISAPDISPFASVVTLRLSSMQFNDIVNLIDWYPNLQVLDCDGIQTLASQVTVALTAFKVLGQLRVLKLHFASMCELAEGMAFSLGTASQPSADQNTRWSLPPHLHTLKLANIYDFEECMVSSVAEAEEGALMWDAMEETLVRKYWVLTTLHNLTNLALDNCKGFTARVWRECVTPCTRQLKRLSLCGWDRGRESPGSARDDMELALAELFAGLLELETLTLTHFEASPGVVRGLTQLARYKHQVLDAAALQNTCPPTCDMAHCPHNTTTKINFGPSLV